MLNNFMTLLLLLICYALKTHEQGIIDNRNQTSVEAEQICKQVTFDDIIANITQATYTCLACQRPKPLCFAPEHWNTLKQELGEERLVNCLLDFCKEYIPEFIALGQKYPEGSLVVALEAQASKDPLIKAMINNDKELFGDLLESRKTLLDSRVVLDLIKVDLDYISVALLLAYLNQEDPDHYFFFNELLKAGASPDGRFVIDDTVVPLIFLATFFHMKEALKLLVEFHADTTLVFKGHTLYQVNNNFEQLFGCQGLVELLDQARILTLSEKIEHERTNSLLPTDEQFSDQISDQVMHNSTLDSLEALENSGSTDQSNQATTEQEHYLLSAHQASFEDDSADDTDQL